MHLCRTSNSVTVACAFLLVIIFALVETGNCCFSIGKVEGDGYLEAPRYQSWPLLTGPILLTIGISQQNDSLDS
jgi:hypothetical protein